MSGYMNLLQFCVSRASRAMRLEKELLELHSGIESLEDRLMLAGNPLEIGPYDPGEILDVDGTAYFATSNLFKTNGTAASTVQVTDLNPGGRAGPSYLARLGGHVFFAQVGDKGNELYKANIATGLVTLVKDITPGVNGSAIRKITATDNLVYFYLDGSNRELWRSDGTAAGTFQIEEINPAGTADPEDFTPVGDKLFFSANDGTHGRELWISDGTSAGTKMVRDIYPNASNSGPRYLTEMNGSLFFAATEPTTGRELWKSDGTIGGTSLFANIRSDASSSSPTELANINGTLYFNAVNQNGKNSLWKSDGVASTTQLKEFDSNPYRAGSEGFTEAGGIVFFLAYDDATDKVLWKTDGTINGTQIVKDILPGRTGSEPIYEMTSMGGKLFFRFNSDSAVGSEMWESDGTAAGTHVAFDLVPGPNGSSPLLLTNVGDSLYFVAKIGQNIFSGRSLWKYSLPITVDGTAGNDTFFIDTRTQNVIVRNNGVSQSYAKSAIGQIRIQGFAGSDSLTILGSGEDETVYLRSNKSITFRGAGYEIIATATEVNRVEGQGGLDKVYFYDSAGNDNFLAKHGLASMVGAGFSNVALGFERMYANASRGSDTAKMFDSKGNDKFVGKPTTATMSSALFLSQAKNFDKVLAYASSGIDSAKFFDSSGSDTFVGRKTQSLLKGSGYLLKVKRFEKVRASASGGNDLAVLYDSSGNDQFVGDDQKARLVGAGFFYQVKKFEKVKAYASKGNDKAVLKGSTQADKFVGRNSKGTLSNSKFLLFANKFDTVRADGRGGLDVLNARNLNYNLVHVRFEKIV